MTTYLPLLNFKTILKALAIGSLMFLYAIAFSGQSFASPGINRTINFQGKVVNKTPGTNVTNGAYDFTFRLYDAASGGSLLWTENWTGGNQITVTDGIFRATLGSITTFASAGVDFNTDNLYLDIAFNGETFGTRIRFAAVPYAINAEKVSGLTVTNTTGTFTLTNAKTFSVANTLSFSGTDSTSFVFPSTSGGTVLTTNAPSQTITSTQTTGTVLAIADSTGLSGAITGQSISLTSSTNSQDKTGISFDLSGGTGGTYYDLLGTGSTWNITRAGVLTVASCSGCGGGGGTLQQAYAAGETISVTSGEGALSFDLASANFDITVGEGSDTGDLRFWDGSANWFFIDESADTLALGAAAGSGLTLGGSGITTTNAGLLSVSEAFSTDGTSTFGNAAADTITFTGSVNSNINFLDAATGSSYNVNGSDATGATNAGGALSIRAGNGGASSGDGGALTLAGGTTNSGTAGYIALQTGGTERFRVVGDGTFLFEKGSSVDVVLSVTAASGGDRTLTIPQLTADDTFALVTKAQTLASKTLTSPTLTTSPTAAGATWTDLGTVTTADINGGTADAVVIGGSSAAAGTFTALGGADLTLGISDTSATITTQDTDETLTIDPNGTGAVNFHGSSFSLTSAGVFSLADITLGTSDSSATITTADTDENLTIDPNGTGTIFFHGGTYGITSAGVLTVSSCSGCGGGVSLFADGGTFAYLDSTYADDLVLGGATVAAGSFFFDESAAMLYLGNDDTDGGGGDTGENGGLTFYSSGASITDPTITVDASGNLTISAGQTGASVILGDGSGNIELTLTAAADVLLADKTVALGGAYSATDYTFKRVLTSNAGGETQGGILFYITDTGAADVYTADASLLVVNSALTSGTFTGNLLDLQIGGSTEFKVDASGNLAFAGGALSDTSDGVDIADALEVSGLITANGGLTISAAQTFTINSDAFTDLTGDGLEISSGVLRVKAIASADALSSTTSSGSGLEVLSGGLTLLQGCADSQVLKWNETTDVWECNGSLQTFYNADTDGSDAIVSLTTADGSLIFRNPSSSGTDSGYVAKVDKLNTGNVDGLQINNDGTGAHIAFLDTVNTIEIPSGGSIRFVDDGGNNLYAGFKEYFGTANYGAYEANGFINIDGTFLMENFNNTGATQASFTVDATGTSKFGDNRGFVFDAFGQAATNGCTLTLWNTSTNNLNGVVQLSPITNQSGCWFYHDGVYHTASTATNATQTTAGVLNISNKFVMYYKAKVSTEMTSALTSRFFYFGADNLHQQVIGAPTIAESTRGGIWLSNVTYGNVAPAATNASLTKWAGVARYGTGSGATEIQTEDCSQNIVGGAFFLARLEARATNDVHFFLDNDLSNGISLSECGDGVTQGIPTNGQFKPSIFVGNVTGITTRGTVYLDFVAYVQDDPRPDASEQVAGASTESEQTNSEPPPPPDPIQGADVSEYYYFDKDSLNNMEPGDVVALGDERGYAKKATRPYDRRLLGVYAESPGLILGQSNESSLPIALSGRVPVKVSTQSGKIKIGDPLTSSKTEGVAIKATNPGKIIGTAMENYEGEEIGKILVNVNTGYYLGDEQDTALIEQKSEMVLGESDIATSSGALDDAYSEATKSATTSNSLFNGFSIAGLFESLGEAIFRGPVEFLSNVKFIGKVSFHENHYHLLYY